MPQIPFDDVSTLVQVMAWCLGSVITWTTVDQDFRRHMTSLGHNELTDTDNWITPINL